MEIVIKNMVCPRCIAAVQEVFTRLNIPILSMELGRVITSGELNDEKQKTLKEQLNELGFEWLDDRNTRLINDIKSIIIQEIHHHDEEMDMNFSTLLSEKLYHEYSYLSRLFSSVEGRTIEKFIIAQKIEKVKELMTYDEMTLSEIAFKLNYSSSAHLSSQFKKVTGMSPTQFKKLQSQPRRSINDI